jgi:nicotinamidase-related amidase
MPHPTIMSTDDTALLVIDVQDKLLALFPDSAALVRDIAFLVDAARLLQIPVTATEQYPKGLGPSTAELAERVPERPDKTAFSCCAIPAVVEGFRRAARPKVLLAGIEAHVCVLLTALDLIDLGFRVYIAADAVASRFPGDRDIALRRMEQAGAIVTTVEAAVFEWLASSQHPRFKAISQLVQSRMQALRV